MSDDSNMSVTDRLRSGSLFTLFAASVLALFAYWSLKAQGDDYDQIEARLHVAKMALAAAGFPDATLERGQAPAYMGVCEVGQLRHRGQAYAWKSPQAAGAYCSPEDGRRDQIVVFHGIAKGVRPDAQVPVRMATPREQRWIATVR